MVFNLSEFKWIYIQLVDCSGGGLQRCAILWLMNASFLVDFVGRPTSLPPHLSSFLFHFEFLSPFLSFPSFSSLFFPLFLILFSHPSLEWPWRGATGRPRCRLRGGGGGHQAWDHPGSQRLRLPPPRPARALPRPGPHAPISEEPLGGVGGRSAR